MKKELTKAEKTRQSLIQTAQRLFNEQGYVSTGVDQIVASMGVTSGVFYANFKSKDELLKTVLQQQIERATELLLTPKPGECIEDWLQRSISIYLAPRHRDDRSAACPLTTMSQELIKLDLVKATGLDRYRLQFEERLTAALEQLAPGHGSVAPALMSLCIGAIESARLETNRKKSDLYLELIRQTAFRLIRRDF